jgi:hypothetical protein
MPSYSSRTNRLSQFSIVHRSLMHAQQLPLDEAISAERIAEVFRQEGLEFGHEEDAVYTPAVTLWGLLSQVLFAREQRSCLAAVVRIVALWAVLGRRVCGTNTGAYCRARRKIKASALRRISSEIAQNTEARLLAAGPTARQAIAPHLRAHSSGRFLMMDGFTVTAADTEENQAEYPQNPAQQAGLGFPILRGVVLMSLASGLLIDAELGPYCGKETGETALFWKLRHQLRPGDTLIGDSYYCTYWILAACQQQRVAVVMRNHHLRKDNLALAKRLRDGEHEVTWKRPPRPDWMTVDEYASLPPEVRVRLVQVSCAISGQRTQQLTIATTRLDHVVYSGEWLASIYRGRWTVELDIRAIKVTLGMDILRAKTPEMVRTELWSCLLVYNLIRHSMLQAACQAGVRCREMSFTATLQLLGNLWLVNVVLELTAELRELRERQQTEIVVGQRPDRYEPRANKRRPKMIALLTKPRAEAQAELLNTHQCS